MNTRSHNTGPKTARNGQRGREIVQFQKRRVFVVQKARIRAGKGFASRFDFLIGRHHFIERIAQALKRFALHDAFAHQITVAQQILDFIGLAKTSTCRLGVPLCESRTSYSSVCVPGMASVLKGIIGFNWRHRRRRLDQPGRYGYNFPLPLLIEQLKREWRNGRRASFRS